MCLAKLFCIGFGRFLSNSGDKIWPDRSLSCTPSLGELRSLLVSELCHKLVSVHEDRAKSKSDAWDVHDPVCSLSSLPRHWSFVEAGRKSSTLGETFFKLSCCLFIRSRPHAKSPVGFGTFDFTGNQFLLQELDHHPSWIYIPCEACHQDQR